MIGFAGNFLFQLTANGRLNPYLISAKENPLSTRLSVSETLQEVVSFDLPQFDGGGRTPVLVMGELSPWSRSAAKRVFDCACVLITLPLWLPLFILIAGAVRLTSSGPIIFKQMRMGRYGRPFTIFKFRTLLHTTTHNPVTTANNQRFTPIGPFLRHWKLDELPQLLNVLAGHMSLIGPRPKILEHVALYLNCRPGITGAATIAFAHEAEVLARVPSHYLDHYYHKVILPAKRRLDSAYMARATFRSDLRLIFGSLLRHWEKAIVDELLQSESYEVVDLKPSKARASVSEHTYTKATISVAVELERSAKL